MTLALRARIDPSSVTAQSGAGGMGEVYWSGPASSGEECVRER